MDGWINQSRINDSEWINMNEYVLGMDGWMNVAQILCACSFCQGGHSVHPARAESNQPYYCNREVQVLWSQNHGIKIPPCNAVSEVTYHPVPGTRMNKARVFFLLPVDIQHTYYSRVVVSVLITFFTLNRSFYPSTSWLHTLYLVFIT